MILLIPHSDPQSSLGALRAMIWHSLPFGIAALASVLERDAIPVQVVNDSIAPVQPGDLQRLARQEHGRPVFGITCMTLQVPRTLELHAMIRQAVPEAAIIVGGIHATAMPEELFAGGVEYLFAGEADAVISDIARKMSAGEDIRQIPGVMWRDELGEVRRNPRAPMVDLDSLPPFPYHLFPAEHYDFSPILISRGCPFGCIFCSQRTMTARTYRTLSPAKALDQIETVVSRYGVNAIAFYDDNLIVDRERAKSLLQGIVDRGLHRKVTFMGQMRADALTDELFDLLKAANFDLLSFGIETGSERMAKVIKKAETVSCNAGVVREAKRRGFRVAATFIAGLPTETEEDRRASTRLALELPLDQMRMNIAVPYPGTPFWAMARKKVHVAPGWKNFNVVSPLVTGPFAFEPLPYTPEGATESDIRYRVLSTNLRFWLKPSNLRAFFGKKTALTRLPENWYRDFEFLSGMAKYSFTILSCVAWVCLYAARNASRSLFSKLLS